MNILLSTLQKKSHQVFLTYIYNKTTEKNLENVEMSTRVYLFSVAY